MGVVCIFSVTGFFFSQALHTFTEYSKKRMILSAEYAQQYLDMLFFSAVQEFDDEEIDRWLADFIMSAGFERLIITDTAEIVAWSSHTLINKGDDFSPYILDDTLFHKALQQQRTYYTSTQKIGSAYFASLYYPCIISGVKHMICIDADQNYFHEALRYRTMLIAIGVFFVCITATMIVLLILVDKKATYALHKAMHNERLAFLGRTSGELAHELKNPLGIMKTSVDVLRMRYDPTHQEQVFTFLSDEVMRLAGLIESILSFSRENVIRTETFSPSIILEKFISEFKNKYPEITIDLSIDQSIKFNGDRQAFRMITSNLLENAGSAMDGRGTIGLHGEVHGGQYQLLFKDSGPGISAVLSKRIFEPFVTGSQHGTGLGLTIVKSLCDALGWEIRLLCAAKGKTTFGLFLKEGLWEKS
jgi:signal transduction histidine kinase